MQLRKGSNASKTPEIKLIVLLGYYTVSMLIYLAGLCSVFYDTLRYYPKRAMYAACERGGVQPGGMVCDRSAIQNVTFPAFLTLMIAAICFFPVANLIYAINVQEVKVWCRRLRKIGRDGEKSTTSTPQQYISSKATSPKVSCLIADTSSVDMPRMKEPSMHNREEYDAV